MLYVCPLSQIDDAVARHAPSHMLTLVGPTVDVATPPSIEADKHLRITLHDIAAPKDGHITPEADHVQQVIDFVQAWNAGGPLLIHCWAGISRSTAAAFITLCMMEDQTPEEELAARLRAAAPFCLPNTLLVAHADRLLGRNGRMSEAIELLDDIEPVMEGELFAVPFATAP